MKTVEAFARDRYGTALDAFPKVDADVLKQLSEFVGIPPVVLKYWKLDISQGNGSAFLTSLLPDEGLALGSYDGRVTADDTGIAGYVDPNSGGNDPTMTAVGGVYTAMWNAYLNDELRFTSTSPFTALNDQAFLNWNFNHTDPTGAQRGGGNTLYTAGDLAAAMALNPYFKVFSANGYYDAVTPFFQTILNFEAMPLKSPHARSNLSVHNYPSGHMVYLDDASRSAMKSDLAQFYPAAMAQSLAAPRARPAKEEAPRMGRTEYARRIGRVPY
jgi:carboxypeptidase C (cathepsin A)